MYRDHIEYAAWASNHLMIAAAQLTTEELNRDFQTADKSVLGTLVHIFAADRVWLARVRGQVQQFVSEEDRSLDALQKNWPVVYEGWRQVISEVPIEREIAYTDLKGNPYTTPLSQIILHVVNHGTHHRGQVSGMLRTMGHAPPQLDLIRYYREQNIR